MAGRELLQSGKEMLVVAHFPSADDVFSVNNSSSEHIVAAAVELVFCSAAAV